MKAPFPWFGGKSTVSDIIWDHFGTVANYCEPFFGSGAVLLGRPGWTPATRWTETVNDADGLLSNFWRALRSNPDEVAYHADFPVSESDIEARHLWLVNRRKEITDGLNDPDWFDAKAAGWWVWGCSCWIGSGWCSGAGPWVWDENRKIVDSRKRPHLGGGRGVNRKLPHLGDDGRGVNRQLPQLGGFAQQRHGIENCSDLAGYLGQLADRLRHVRVCCGDWRRILGPTPTTKFGMTAVFLDPPYTDKANRAEVYANDSESVGHDVAQWCRENQGNPLLKIALCGYEGEHELPGWECVAWKAAGGYENQSAADDGPSGNCKRERIWFSPNCESKQGEFFP